MQKVIAIVSRPQEVGYYKIIFVNMYDGQKVMKPIIFGDAEYGDLTNILFDRQEDGSFAYRAEEDYLAQQMKDDYGVQLPTTIDERAKIGPDKLIHMVTQSMGWDVCNILKF